MISKAVAWHTFHQHHWIRISLVGLVGLGVFLSSSGTEQFPIIALTPFLVWLLGSGIIGRDIASGVAHLLFTRPITRRDYILTKWVSLGGGVALVQAVLFLIWIIGKFILPMASFVSPQSHAMDLNQLIIDTMLSLWITMVLSPVVILFSTIMKNWGDLALLLYAHVLLFILNISASNDHSSYMKDFNDGYLRILWPGVKIGYDYINAFGMHYNDHGNFPSAGDMALDSCIGAVYLVLALYLMSRKDMGTANI